MKTQYLIPIAIIILGMVFLFSNNKKAKQNMNNEVEIESDLSESNEKGLTSNLKLENIRVAEKSFANSSDVSLAEKSILNEERQINEKVLRQFSIHLKAMTKCLNLSGSQNINDETEPNIENLLTQLKTSLGDIVAQTDDWSQTEFIEQNVKKRVRIDYDYPDGVTPYRRLSMYMINSYNMPEIINLSEDAMNNPNEAYIASLSEGQNIINKEKGSRAYFADGEELIFSQRNGQLQNISINKGDNSFNCFNLGEEGSNCTCP